MASCSAPPLRSPAQCLKAIVGSGIICLLCAISWAQSQISVPLTIQESLYAGVSGVNRSQEPVTVGVPLPDSAHIASTSQLALSGATAAQFRVLARWPSGNIKWVLVDTLADLSAGQKSTAITLTNGGGGNSGGANLAADNVATITVNTGAAVFSIRKANHDVFNKVVIGGTTVIDSSVHQSDGLVVAGPASGTSCTGSCTTDYKSSNDSASTCSIEENGPVRAAVKCSGSYVNGSITYMHWTTRMHFYKGKAYAKINVSLRNADDTTGDNTFQSANKGMSANELRLTPVLGSGKGFTFGNHTGTPTTGAFSGNENTYLYQAFSTNLLDQELSAGYLKGRGGTYSQSGYQITQSTTNLQTGSKSQYPEGWGDLYDSTGAGVEVGVYQASAYWPKSIQFQSGGSEVRVGIWPNQKLYTGCSSCAISYYQPWPQHSIHDLFINFHAAALSNMQRSATFKCFQYPLIARASYDWYNQADVFNYKIPNPADEDIFYQQQAQAVGEPNPGNYTYSDVVPSTWRYHGWHDTGGLNQHDFRMADLLDWLQRGSTGRYLNAMYFYRYVSELGMPRADGFHWNSHAASDGNVDAGGFPLFASQNTPSVARSWLDQEHAHIYGLFDYYFLSGDETMRDFLFDAPVTRWMNPNVYLAWPFSVADASNGGACPEAFPGDWGCGIWNERALGEALHTGSKLWEFLKSTGDLATYVDADCSSRPSVCGPLKLANLIARGMVLQDLKANGYGTRMDAGTSPILGVQHLGPQSGCGNYRNLSPFFEGILLNGIYALARANGPSWQYYWPLMDKLEGIAQWGANTGWNAATNQNWYNMYLDVANNSCTSDGYVLENNVELATFWTLQHEYSGGTAWSSGFANMVKGQFGWSMYDDLWSYTLKDGVYRMKNPSSRPTLVTVPFASFTDNGGGSYTISWNPPANVQQYRLKYSQGRQVVDWVRYNPSTNTFIDNPAAQWPWFSATEVSAPAASASSATLTGLPVGLTSSNFQLRAYTSSSGGAGDITPPVIAITSPSNGAVVSGVVAVSASASDNVGVTSVAFAINGTQLGSQLASPPYSASWDTTSIANGSHSVTATARDAAGNTSSSSSVVTVSNADRTPPTVAITSPASGGTISGSTTIAASASDNIDVASVSFTVDGKSIGSDTTAPYSITWSSTSVANGVHTIAAVARDAAGNSTPASITVTVSNTSKPDTTPPAVAISSPANGAVVSGSVSLTATVTDDVGVSSVTSRIDGNRLGAAETSAPFAVTWNTSASTAGPHVVSAEARDAAGNVGSAQIAVQVQALPQAGRAVVISSSTRFSVEEQDLNTIVACPYCFFQGVSDLMMGQTAEIWLQSGVAPASDRSRH